MTADELKEQISRAQWAEIQVLKQNQRLRLIVIETKKILDDAILTAIVGDTK